MQVEKQRKINMTLRKYESQNGQPCRANVIVSGKNEGDQHFLVKCLICRAIETGKHLGRVYNEFDGYPMFPGNYHYFLSSWEDVGKQPLEGVVFWENDRAGQEDNYITEAIDIKTKDRCDVIRLSDNKRIEIIDTNSKPYPKGTDEVKI